MERLSLRGKLHRISAIRIAIRKRIAQVKRGLHVARVMSLGMLLTHRPLLVHIVPMRRCNLACAYCNEYDSFSQPVPLDAMLRRIDKLASLGTAIITVSGGEPLMHPELDQIIAHIRERGIVTMLLTNGYLLTEQRIERLNGAGLEFMQISIDNVNPDEVSMKSLKVLDQKLVLLRRFAEFGVNVNSVLGSGIKHPEDALVIARRASELGFTTSVGIVHGGNGNLRPLSDLEKGIYQTIKNIGIYQRIKNIGAKKFGLLHRFEENLVHGRPNEWRCRAGARYLYIDENGLVHYCSQQRGYPALPLSGYSQQDIRREYFTKKACAAYCTVACVQRISWFDSWRDPQTLERRMPVSAKLEQRQQD